MSKMGIEPVPPFSAVAGSMPKLPGRYITRLMRRHGVTIAGLAKRMNITQKRVREVRLKGVEGNCMCLDWFEGISSTGLYAQKVADVK